MCLAMRSDSGWKWSILNAIFCYHVPINVCFIKLLLILSDGRGVMNEGKAKVIEAVRETRMRDVFTVFVIVETEESRESVLDQRVVTSDLKFVPYCSRSLTTSY